MANHLLKPKSQADGVLTTPDSLRDIVLAKWREVAPASGLEPGGIELVKGRNRSTALEKPAVIRLCDVGPENLSVIAKRVGSGTARTEQLVYEQLLPKLSIPKLEYYGACPEDGRDFFWLFMEDAGSVAYTAEIDAHRLLASRWLAQVHVESEGLVGTIDLPDRGPRHYLTHLRDARKLILLNIEKPHIELDLRTALRDILECCDQLEEDWTRIEVACKEFPKTFVHGDFVEKNLRVREGAENLELFPFDWETSGWGVPAGDLAQLDGRVASPDVGDYAMRVASAWPGLEWADHDHLARIGALFRVLAAISWESEGLPFADMPRMGARFERYQSILKRAVMKIESLR